MKKMIKKYLSGITALVCLTACCMAFIVNAGKSYEIYTGSAIVFDFEGQSGITLVSENPDIAEVRDNYVYGISEGTAVINIMLSDGSVADSLEIVVKKAYTKYYLGDVNADNKVDSSDVALMQKYFTKKISSLENPEAGDIDRNGEINIFDIIDLKRFIIYGVYPGTDASEPAVTTPVTTTAVTTTSKVATTTTTTVTKVTTTTAKATTAAMPAEQVARQKANEVLELVNEARASEGAEPIVMDETLFQAAMLRADEISNLFSHTRPDGTKCFTVLDEFGVSGYFNVGENISAGDFTAEDTMERWLASQGHHDNIVNPEFTKIGIGYVYVPDSQYKYYWVQLFTD